MRQFIFYQGPSMNSPKKKKINVLVVSASFIPSVVICVLRPLIALEQLGEISLRMHPGWIKFLSARDITWCDIAIFPRGSEYYDLNFLHQLKQLGKKIIYDIDDNFEEIPISIPIGQHHRTPHRLHVLRRFFAFSDITRIYSARMQYRAKQHHANIRLVKNCFDTQLIADLPTPKASTVVKIAYPTSRQDDPRQEALFYETLRQILIKYPSQIEINLWRAALPAGKLPEKLQHFQNIRLHENINNYEDFIKSFYTEAYDIGLAPLIDEPFFHSKTNTKYREFGGCGVAGVYSNIPPYNDCILQKKSGVLVNNTVKDWVEGISLLIDNPLLRQKIAKNAKQDVLKNYTFDMTVNTYRQCLHEALKNTSPPIPWTYLKNTKLRSCYIHSSSISDIHSKKIQQRFQRLTSALNYFQGHMTGPQTPSVFLSKPNLTKQYNQVCFLVQNNNDFLSFQSLFRHCNNIILDLSLFNDDTLKFQYLFNSHLTQKPTHFILDEKQVVLEVIAKTYHIPWTFISYTNDTPEIQFSLESAEAAYLDIVEKNIHFNTPKITFLSRLILILHGMTQCFQPKRLLKKIKYTFIRPLRLLWWERQNIWLHIQWRIGRRVL
jgi:glycosyltransferase involved in cell wall biosynthesis